MGWQASKETKAPLNDYRNQVCTLMALFICMLFALLFQYLQLLYTTNTCLFEYLKCNLFL